MQRMESLLIVVIFFVILLFTTIFFYLPQLNELVVVNNTISVFVDFGNESSCFVFIFHDRRDFLCCNFAIAVEIQLTECFPKPFLFVL